MASLREDRHPWHSSTATLCDRRDWAAAALRASVAHTNGTSLSSQHRRRGSVSWSKVPVGRLLDAGCARVLAETPVGSTAKLGGA